MDSGYGFAVTEEFKVFYGVGEERFDPPDFAVLVGSDFVKQLNGPAVVHQTGSRGQFHKSP